MHVFLAAMVMALSISAGASMTPRGVPESPGAPQLKACIAMLQLDNIGMGPKLSAYSLQYPVIASFIESQIKDLNPNTQLSKAIMPVENQLTTQGYSLTDIYVELQGSRNGFAGNTDYFNFVRTYTNPQLHLSIQVNGAFNFVRVSSEKASNLMFAKLELGEPTALDDKNQARANAAHQPNTKAPSNESQLLLALEKIAAGALVGNGSTKLEDYDPAKFSLAVAQKQIADARPDIKSGRKIVVTFKTEVGIESGLKLLASSDVKTEGDDTSSQIRKLYQYGYIKNIVYRFIDKTSDENYLIPYLFDIYFEYVGSSGAIKGQVLRLHYELGD